MSKYICIKEHIGLEKIYEIGYIFDSKIVEDYQNKYTYFDKNHIKNCISTGLILPLSEWREQRINEILND